MLKTSVSIQAHLVSFMHLELQTLFSHDKQTVTLIIAPVVLPKAKGWAVLNLRLGGGQRGVAYSWEIWGGNVCFKCRINQSPQCCMGDWAQSWQPETQLFLFLKPFTYGPSCWGLSTEISGQARCMGSEEGERTQAGRRNCFHSLCCWCCSTSILTAQAKLSQQETDQLARGAGELLASILGEQIFFFPQASFYSSYDSTLRPWSNS